MTRKLLAFCIAVLACAGFSHAQETWQFGYVPNPSATHEFVRSLGPDPIEFDALKLAQEPLREEEHQLYRNEIRCLQASPELARRYLSGGRKNAPNQGSVGSCTGFGTAGVLNIAFAKFCVDNRIEHFYRPVSESAAYAIGREEGGILGGSDGGFGAACAKSTKTMGMLRKVPYPLKDLTEYTETDARELGRYGVGKYSLKPDALKMLAGTVVAVRSAAEAKVVIRNGMGINVCSMQAFRTTRNKDGICEADNTKRWAHSMTVVGYRTVNIDGKYQTLFRIQNSWGNGSPTGPMVGDMGYGMFDIREEVMDKMLAQGDSFAYGDLIVENAPESLGSEFGIVEIVAGMFVAIAVAVAFRNTLASLVIIIATAIIYTGWIFAGG
jgi:Papain family cysteine protease.